MLFSYYRRPLFLLLLAYAGGIFAFRHALLKPPADLPFPLPRAGAAIEGRVTEYPASVPGGLRFAVETTSVYGAPLKAGLMVYARGEAGGASYGDTVSLFADLEAPPGASVPGSLDWADYLARRGIGAQARAHEVEVIKPAGWLLLKARGFRSAALSSFRAGLAPEAAAVFGGVVLGEKRSVPQDLKAAFQDSGAMHLLVASGSNVGFVVAVVYFLCSKLGLGRRYSGLAALGLAGFYVLAAGLDTPLVRGYLMFAAGLGAWLLRRESGAFQALTAAALLILLLLPRSLFEASFQMSFLASYGLVVGMALWGQYVKAGGLAGGALGLLLVSFFAQLCLYPVLAVYFHKISLVSLLSNMILVPASGVAMGIGFLLALSGGWLFRALAWTAGLFMEFFIGTVRFFAGLPFAAVSVPEPSAWFVAGFFVLAFALLHAPLLGFRRRRLYFSAAAGLGVIAAGTLSQFWSGGEGGRRALLFGDSNTSCVLVRAPAGFYLANPGLAGRKLADALLAEGRRSLEGVLLTSLEEKNYNGLEELARLVTVKNIFVPYGPQPQPLRALLERSAAGGCRVHRLWPGEEVAGVRAGWSGPAGYTGGGITEWEAGGLRIRNGGALAESACGGYSAVAQRGKTVLLEFFLPAGGCGR